MSTKRPEGTKARNHVVSSIRRDKGVTNSSEELFIKGYEYFVTRVGRCSTQGRRNSGEDKSQRIQGIGMCHWKGDLDGIKRVDILTGSLTALDDFEFRKELKLARGVS